MDDSAGRYVEQLTSTSTGGEAPLIISYSQVTDSNVSSTLAYLFIAFGCVTIFVAFIGCCGAVRENQCMLGTVRDDLDTETLTVPQMWMRIQQFIFCFVLFACMEMRVVWSLWCGCLVPVVRMWIRLRAWMRLIMHRYDHGLL